MADRRRSSAVNGIFGEKTPRHRRKFVLCFDGTGNKFQGTAGDSNILKIYSMLERTDKTQFHYYQPGIGTYRNTASLSSSSSTISRLKSWYAKGKDIAVGTTLDEHVMAGYRFLMRYYQDGDDIYLFGFSRGAYIARFLSEMLDHVGLLSKGNEELVRFVWKTFARWQQRNNGNEDAKEKERELFKFMKAFRETFSRPVRRIRFLGLFDTVNSVSKFETAWMRRGSRFPYTAHSSAITICHAVSIDERRAKFRQDLISQKKSKAKPHFHLNHFRRQSAATAATKSEVGSQGRSSIQTEDPGKRFRSRSRGRSRTRISPNRSSIGTGPSEYVESDQGHDSDDEHENAAQTIKEVWFPGCHADIGGGWNPEPPENLSLSHAPLVWMLCQAQKAGLVFDREKMSELGCYYDETANTAPVPAKRTPIQENRRLTVPTIEVNDDIIPISDPFPEKTIEIRDYGIANPEDPTSDVSPQNKKFLQFLHDSSTKGKIHDPLQRNQGTPLLTVLTWNTMEFLPFRRMDLRPDGSWKAISWPLPMGETRDVPFDVVVHNSVIRRMKADEGYRPGNLIVGGGGRGMRRAPRELGIGEWVVCEEGKGDVVDECWVRAKKNNE